jgi:hypothetical protein
VSNTGVVSTDTAAVGSPQLGTAAASYGTGGRAVFCFGTNPTAMYSRTNYVANTGVVESTTTTVATAKQRCAACGYSIAF